jgi:hypothetical protein
VTARIGDADSAADCAAALAELADRGIVWWSPQGVCEGAVARLLGNLAATMQNWDEAERWLTQAIVMEERMGATPFLARSRRDLGRVLLSRGAPSDTRRAGSLLDQAGETFELLGMDLDRELMPRAHSSLPSQSNASPRPTRSDELGFVREAEYWTVSLGAEVGRFEDSDGMRYLRQLLDHAGDEMHVLELLRFGRRRSGPEGAHDAGDAGPMLDQAAKDAYRHRLADLNEELDDASRCCDAGRGQRAQREIEALHDELARAVGLSGRDRRAASAAERARVNVTLRIKRALGRISEQCPAIGAHLAARVRTGSFCSYRH